MEVGEGLMTNGVSSDTFPAAGAANLEGREQVWHYSGLARDKFIESLVDANDILLRKGGRANAIASFDS